jgi:hypothetical protein
VVAGATGAARSRAGEDQVTRIDQVFTETWPALHRAKIDLDTLEQELSALIASADADERTWRDRSTASRRRGLTSDEPAR